MKDHGTKVQCPKCNEWVSGAHNCDIWTMECKECEGSGEGFCERHLDKVTDFCISSCNERTCGPCPHCKGKGGFNLGMEKPCDNRQMSNIPCLMHCEGCENLKEKSSMPKPVMIGDSHWECNSDGMIYRPLSCEEVEEWAKDEASRFCFGYWHEHLQVMLTAIKNEYTVRYKGQPVKLMPREG